MHIDLTIGDAEMQIIGRFLSQLRWCRCGADAEAHAETQRLLANLIVEIRSMSGTLDTGLATLTTDVAALKTVAAGASALLNGIKDRIDAAVAAAGSAGATPDQLASFTALTTDMEATTAGLAAAVLANTPAAATEPVPEPAPLEPDPAPTV